jgi:VCBS repeat-containing protein
MHRSVVVAVLVAATVVLVAPAAARAAGTPGSLRATALTPSLAASAGAETGVFAPVVASAASPAVHIAPGSLFGYIPLDAFGVTPTPIGDEDIINFNVPSFRYNGATHTVIGVDSNGYIVVGGGAAADNNCCAPVVGSPDPPNGVLAPFWTDLDGTGAPGIFAATLTDGVDTWLVVEWRVNVFGTNSLRKFQLWIGVNGVEDITYAYDPAALPADPNGYPFVVGAENLDGSSGASIVGLPTQDLRVTSDNAAPVASDDGYTTNEDTPLSVAAPGVLGNDTDADADALTATLVSGPSHGTLALNADGSFSYTSAANYNGPDSFTYKANDGTADSNVATVTLTVNPVNDPPVAGGDSYSTNEDTVLSVAAPGVLGNDADVDGDALTAVLVSGPSHGTLVFHANGAFSYTPAPDYNGPDSFTYRANDGNGAVSNVATVTITVGAVNDAPTVTVAAGGSCGGDDRSGTVNLALADVDSPAGSLTLSGSSSNAALVPNGNLAFSGSGASRSLSIATAAATTGTAVITVTVSDGTATGTVAITVRAGGNGVDTLTGTTGADLLLGQNGGDSLDGQAGNDLLCGGRGGDTLTGGPGADRFGGGQGTDTATDLTPPEGDTQDGTIP